MPPLPAIETASVISSPQPMKSSFFEDFFSKNAHPTITVATYSTDNYRKKCHFTFTGKERDAETGYSYFGARYYDSGLPNIFLSVDPLSDKYPSISPYAYCAWNPMKLVDPDGREIVLSDLSPSIQQRLVNCLSKLTGLTLFIDNQGRLDYKKDNEGNAICSSGSKTARLDLIAAIDKKNEDGTDYTIDVTNGRKCEGGQYEDQTGGLIRMYCGRMQEQEDCGTLGLGMVFLHELRHAVTGESDPDEDGAVSLYVGNFVNTNNRQTGPVVDRVNEYRRELNMPLRVMYVGRKDGLVPFCLPAIFNNNKAIRRNTIWIQDKSSM